MTTKSLSLSCQVRLQRRRPHDKTHEAELVTLVTNQVKCCSGVDDAHKLSLLSFHALACSNSACNFPLLHFIFSLCWIYAASAPSVFSGIRVCILDSLFPPKLCVYKSSHILEPVPRQRTVLLTAIKKSSE